MPIPLQFDEWWLRSPSPEPTAEPPPPELPGARGGYMGTTPGTYNPPIYGLPAPTSMDYPPGTPYDWGMPPPASVPVQPGVPPGFGVSPPGPQLSPYGSPWGLPYADPWSRALGAPGAPGQPTAAGLPPGEVFLPNVLRPNERVAQRYEPPRGRGWFEILAGHPEDAQQRALREWVTESPVYPLIDERIRRVWEGVGAPVEEFQLPQVLNLPWTEQGRAREAVQREARERERAGLPWWQSPKYPPVGEQLKKLLAGAGAAWHDIGQMPWPTVRSAARIGNAVLTTAVQAALVAPTKLVEEMVFGPIVQTLPAANFLWPLSPGKHMTPDLEAEVERRTTRDGFPRWLATQQVLMDSLRGEPTVRGTMIRDYGDTPQNDRVLRQLGLLAYSSTHARVQAGHQLHAGGSPITLLAGQQITRGRETPEDIREYDAYVEGVRQTRGEAAAREAGERVRATGFIPVGTDLVNEVIGQILFDPWRVASLGALARAFQRIKGQAFARFGRGAPWSRVAGTTWRYMSPEDWARWAGPADAAADVAQAARVGVPMLTGAVGQVDELARVASTMDAAADVAQAARVGVPMLTGAVAQADELARVARITGRADDVGRLQQIGQLLKKVVPNPFEFTPRSQQEQLANVTYQLMAPIAANIDDAAGARALIKQLAANPSALAPVMGPIPVSLAAVEARPAIQHLAGAVDDFASLQEGVPFSRAAFLAELEGSVMSFGGELYGVLPIEDQGLYKRFANDFRSISGEFFLSLNPGYHFSNFYSDVGTMAWDGLLTLSGRGKMDAWFDAYGPTTRRLAGTAAAQITEIRSRGLLGKATGPIRKWATRQEEGRYRRAFYAAHSRLWEDIWSPEVPRALIGRGGLPPDVVSDVTLGLRARVDVQGMHQVIDAMTGEAGAGVDVVRHMERVDDLSPGFITQLESRLNRARSVEEAGQIIDESRELVRTNAAHAHTIDATRPGRRTWGKFELLQDVQEELAIRTEMARQAGLVPEQVDEQIDALRQALVSSRAEMERAAVELGGLLGQEYDEDTARLVMYYMTQGRKGRLDARGLVDDARKAAWAAYNAGTPGGEVWPQYFTDADAAYLGASSNDAAQLGLAATGIGRLRAGETLAQITGKPTQDIVGEALARLRSLSQDVTFRRERMATMRLEEMGLDFDRLLDVNRLAVDTARQNLWRRAALNPGLDSLEIAADATMHADEMGRTTATVVMDAREQMLRGDMTKGQFRRIADEEWGRYFADAPQLLRLADVEINEIPLSPAAMQRALSSLGWPAQEIQGLAEPQMRAVLTSAVRWDPLTNAPEIPIEQALEGTTPHVAQFAGLDVAKMADWTDADWQKFEDTARVLGNEMGMRSDRARRLAGGQVSMFEDLARQATEADEVLDAVRLEQADALRQTRDQRMGAELAARQEVAPPAAVPEEPEIVAAPPPPPEPEPALPAVVEAAAPAEPVDAVYWDASPEERAELAARARAEEAWTAGLEDLGYNAVEGRAGEPLVKVRWPATLDDAIRMVGFDPAQVAGKQWDVVGDKLAGYGEQMWMDMDPQGMRLYVDSLAQRKYEMGMMFGEERLMRRGKMSARQVERMISELRGPTRERAQLAFDWILRSAGYTPEEYADLTFNMRARLAAELGAGQLLRKELPMSVEPIVGDVVRVKYSNFDTPEGLVGTIVDTRLGPLDDTVYIIEAQPDPALGIEAGQFENELAGLEIVEQAQRKIQPLLGVPGITAARRREVLDGASESVKAAAYNLSLGPGQSVAERWLEFAQTAKDRAATQAMVVPVDPRITQLAQEWTSERLFSELEQIYGITDDYGSAGWILPDGTMIDLGGDWTQGTRNTHNAMVRRVVEGEDVELLPSELPPAVRPPEPSAESLDQMTVARDTYHWLLSKQVESYDDVSPAMWQRFVDETRRDLAGMGAEQRGQMYLGGEMTTQEQVYQRRLADLEAFRDQAQMRAGGIQEDMFEAPRELGDIRRISGEVEARQTGLFGGEIEGEIDLGAFAEGAGGVLPTRRPSPVPPPAPGATAAWEAEWPAYLALHNGAVRMSAQPSELALMFGSGTDLTAQQVQRITAALGWARSQSQKQAKLRGGPPTPPSLVWDFADLNQVVRTPGVSGELGNASLEHVNQMFDALADFQTGLRQPLAVPGEPFVVAPPGLYDVDGFPMYEIPGQEAQQLREPQVTPRPPAPMAFADIVYPANVDDLARGIVSQWGLERAALEDWTAEDWTRLAMAIDGRSEALTGVPRSWGVVGRVPENAPDALLARAEQFFAPQDDARRVSWVMVNGDARGVPPDVEGAAQVQPHIAAASLISKGEVPLSTADAREFFEYQTGALRVRVQDWERPATYRGMHGVVEVFPTLWSDLNEGQVATLRSLVAQAAEGSGQPPRIQYQMFDNGVKVHTGILEDATADELVDQLIEVHQELRGARRADRPQLARRWAEMGVQARGRAGRVGQPGARVYPEPSGRYSAMGRPLEGPRGLLREPGPEYEPPGDIWVSQELRQFIEDNDLEGMMGAPIEEFTAEHWEGVSVRAQHEMDAFRGGREVDEQFTDLRNLSWEASANKAKAKRTIARAALEAAEAPTPGISDDMRRYLQERRMTAPEGPPEEAGATLWRGTLNLLMRETGATPGRMEPDVAQQMELLSNLRIEARRYLEAAEGRVAAGPSQDLLDWFATQGLEDPGAITLRDLDNAQQPLVDLELEAHKAWEWAQSDEWNRLKHEVVDKIIEMSDAEVPGGAAEDWLAWPQLGWQIEDVVEAERFLPESYRVPDALRTLLTEMFGRWVHPERLTVEQWDEVGGAVDEMTQRLRSGPGLGRVLPEGTPSGGGGGQAVGFNDYQLKLMTGQFEDVRRAITQPAVEAVAPGARGMSAELREWAVARLDDPQTLGDQTRQWWEDGAAELGRSAQAAYNADDTASADTLNDLQAQAVAQAAAPPAGEALAGAVPSFESRFPVGAAVSYTPPAGFEGTDIEQATVVGYKVDPTTGDTFAEVRTAGGATEFVGDTNDIRRVGAPAAQPDAWDLTQHTEAEWARHRAEARPLGAIAQQEGVPIEPGRVPMVEPQAVPGLEPEMPPQVEPVAAAPFPGEPPIEPTTFEYQPVPSAVPGGPPPEPTALAVVPPPLSRDQELMLQYLTAQLKLDQATMQPGDWLRVGSEALERAMKLRRRADKGSRDSWLQVGEWAMRQGGVEPVGFDKAAQFLEQPPPGTLRPRADAIRAAIDMVPEAERLPHARATISYEAFAAWKAQQYGDLADMAAAQRTLLSDGTLFGADVAVPAQTTRALVRREGAGYVLEMIRDPSGRRLAGGFTTNELTEFRKVFETRGTAPPPIAVVDVGVRVPLGPWAGGEWMGQVEDAQQRMIDASRITSLIDAEGTILWARTPEAQQATRREVRRMVIKSYWFEDYRSARQAKKRADEIIEAGLQGHANATSARPANWQGADVLATDARTASQGGYGGRPSLADITRVLEQQELGALDQISAGVTGEWGQIPPGGRISSDQARMAHDWIESDLRPAMTTLKGVATEGARKSADFALLDYRSYRRRGDEWLALGVPWGFWRTRNWRNWLIRFAERPGAANAFRLYQQYREEENRERDMRERFEGKTGVTVPGLPDWAGEKMYFDPVSYFLPPMQLMPNRWADPIDEASNPFDALLRVANTFGMRPYGFLEMPLRWANVAGQREEQGYLLPQTGLIEAGTALAREVSEGAAARIPPGGVSIEAGVRRGLGLPEQIPWDPYRVGRMISNMAADDPQIAEQALVAGELQRLVAEGQFGVQEAMGWQPGGRGAPVVSPNLQRLAQEMGWDERLLWKAQMLLQTAVQRSGLERAAPTLTRNVMGMRGTIYPTGEERQLELQREAQAQMYSPLGGGMGSRAQLQAWQREHPEATVRSAARSLYEEQEGPYTGWTPEQLRRLTRGREERQTLDREHDAGLDAFLRETPWDRDGARTIEEQYWTARDAIDQQFAIERGGPGYATWSTYGATPDEVRQIRRDEVLSAVGRAMPSLDAYKTAEGEPDWDRWRAAVGTFFDHLPDRMIGNEAVQKLAAEMYTDPETLLRGVTEEQLTAYRRRHDTPMEAVVQVWEDEFYSAAWDRYHRAVERGVEKSTAWESHMEKPGIAADDLIARVQKAYPQRWTDAELRQAYEGVEFPGPAQVAHMRKEPEQRELIEAQEAFWTFFNEDLPPGKLTSEARSIPLIEVILDAETRGTASREQYELALEKLALWKAQNEDREEWGAPVEWAQARAENEKFREVANEMYPNALRLQERYYEMDQERRAQYREDNPELVEYWDFRRFWGEQYPLWSRFYLGDTGAAGGAGAGGAGAGGGITGLWGPAEFRKELHTEEYITQARDENSIFRELVTTIFGEGIYTLQDGYFELPKALRDAFLAEFPQLQAYWDYRRVFADEYPVWGYWYVGAGKYVRDQWFDTSEDWGGGGGGRDYFNAPWAGKWWLRPPDPKGRRLEPLPYKGKGAPWLMQKPGYRQVRQPSSYWLPRQTRR